MVSTDLVKSADALPAIEAEPQRGSMLSIIARAAADPNTDVAKMQALLDMQRQIMAEQARAEFNEAFARLNLPRIPKLGVVDRGQGKGKFPYGRWEDIDAKIRPLLSAEGFSLSFDTKPLGDHHIAVTGTLRHRSGHCETATIGPLALDTSGNKNPVQAVGSTYSYGKRYCASMLLNLTFVGEDTDGVAELIDTRIDDDKVRQIEALLEKTNSDVPRFLRHMRVTKVSDIPVSEFPYAMTLLRRKEREMEEQNDGAA